MRAGRTGGGASPSKSRILCFVRQLPRAFAIALIAVSGLMTVSSPARAGSETFVYDNAGRLIGVDHGDGRVTLYTLDAAGNRTTVESKVGALPGTLGVVTASGTYPESQGTVAVTLRRSLGTSGAASVGVALTASASDATVSPSSVSWAAGNSADKTVTVTIVNDSVIESTESFELVLSGATGAVLGSPGAITLTITDNDLPDTTPPTAPTNLIATAISGTQIDLNWTASTDASGISEYRVERCTGPGCSSFAQIGTSASTAFNSGSLSPSTSYSYRVRAVDVASNVGPYSNVATAATPGPLVANLSATSWSWFKSGNAAPIISANVVVTPGGGAGGYTYAWERVSGPDLVAVASNPTSASTKWTRTVPNTDATYSSVWRCKVTDSSGTFVYTANVNVSFTRIMLE
jgi:YD repeat-containing protein